MTKTIVIIEDEALLLKALNIQLLGTTGVRIFSATEGDAGFALIKEKKPNLVLLDLVLSKISGFEVLHRLKQDPELKQIPVIVLSNLGQKEEQTHALELGAADYFIKSSTNLTDLSKKIMTLLQS